MNRVFLISPTYHTNRHLWDFCKIAPGDAYIRVDQAEDALKHVVTRVREQKRQWEMRQLYMAAALKHTQGKPLNVSERALLEGPAPPDVPLPRPAVILDDLSHSKVMSSRYLINLTLRSRHVAHDPQIGLTMFFLVQSLKAGIPRVLRSNVSAWLVFATKDQSIVNDLHEELSGKISKSEFTELFHSHTANHRDYMVVDLTTRDPTKAFRCRL